jgi:osmotically-inducible protein OsmY
VVPQRGAFRARDAAVHRLLPQRQPTAVTARGSGGDESIERIVRIYVQASTRFVVENLELEVCNGQVRLSGSFENPSDVLALKHDIAAIDGVLDVEIEALLLAGRSGNGSAFS